MTSHEWPEAARLPKSLGPLVLRRIADRTSTHLPPRARSLSARRTNSTTMSNTRHADTDSALYANCSSAGNARTESGDAEHRVFVCDMLPSHPRHGHQQLEDASNQPSEGPFRRGRRSLPTAVPGSCTLALPEQRSLPIDILTLLPYHTQLALFLCRIPKFRPS